MIRPCPTTCTLAARINAKIVVSHSTDYRFQGRGPDGPILLENEVLVICEQAVEITAPVDDLDFYRCEGRKVRDEKQSPLGPIPWRAELQGWTQDSEEDVVHLCYLVYGG